MASISFIQEDIEAWNLEEYLWSGALDTWKDIKNANKEDEAVDYLNNIFCGETPTITTINDILWHERQEVYEAIGLNENGELEENFDELEDGEITTEYLSWLFDHFEDHIYTNAYISVVATDDRFETNNEEHTCSHYTYVELSMDTPVYVKDMDERYFNEVEDFINGYKFSDETLSISATLGDENGYHYWVVEKKQEPTISIAIQVLGRISEDEFTQIEEYIDNLNSKIEEIDKDDTEYKNKGEH